MAKIKVTKKELPFLKRDLELDESVLKELSAVQDRYKTTFKDRIEAAKSESLKRYTGKIDSLTKAKARLVREHNAEIKKYQALVKELKGTVADPVTKAPAKKARISKAPARKAPARKAPTRKK